MYYAYVYVYIYIYIQIHMQFHLTVPLGLAMLLSYPFVDCDWPLLVVFFHRCVCVCVRGVFTCIFFCFLFSFLWSFFLFLISFPGLLVRSFLLLPVLRTFREITTTTCMNLEKEIHRYTQNILCS